MTVNFLKPTLEFKTQQLFAHGQRFFHENDLYPASGHCFVGVSGGRDSMFLLWFLWRVAKIQNFKITAIHIDHGTRQDSINETQLVRDFCNKLDIALIEERLQLSLNSSNFEDLARRSRYEIFAQAIRPQDRVYLGHHIDDSLEWSLMKKFSSSSGNALGIPLVRGPYTRPLMAFTRAQITYICEQLSIPYMNDSSNDSDKFDRNFVRKNIISSISSRYPKYLKHYCQRANKEASKRGVHRKRHSVKNLQVFKSKGSRTLYSLVDCDFTDFVDEIVESIHQLSTGNRGVLHQEVLKFAAAVNKRAAGPMKFSSGVFGLGDKNLMILYREDHALNYQAVHMIDDGTQIPGLSFNELKSIYEKNPNQVLVTFDKSIKGLKSIHPLYEDLTRKIVEAGWQWRTISYCYHRARKYPKSRVFKLFLPSHS